MYGRAGFMGDVVAPKKPPIRAGGNHPVYAPAPLPGDLPTATPESKRNLYLGLGIGAVVVLGGAYLLFRN